MKLFVGMQGSKLHDVTAFVFEYPFLVETESDGGLIHRLIIHGNDDLKSWADFCYDSWRIDEVEIIHEVQ
jgi:hypothetical protein